MKHLAIFILLSISTFISTGCSIIGLAIGANEETDEMYYSDVSKNQNQIMKRTLTEGDTIQIIMNSGDSLQGVFIGFQNLSISQYTQDIIAKYNDSLYVPDVEDTVILHGAVNQVICSFIGFRYGEIIFQDLDGRYLNISLTDEMLILQDSNEILSIEEYEDMYSSKMQSQKFVSFRRYKELMEEDGEYNKLKLILEPDTAIKMRDIYKIELQRRKDYALEGFLVGLGVDTAIVLLWLASDPFTFQMDWN